MEREDQFDPGNAGASARREYERPSPASSRGARRASALGHAATVLHDRRLSGTRTNIDHFAVTAHGVLVIDAKRYRGRIEVRSPLFGDAQLRIAGREKSKLVAARPRQREAVRTALDPIFPKCPSRPAFVSEPGKRGQRLAANAQPVDRWSAALPSPAACEAPESSRSAERNITN